jgi:transcriptional regulator with XRE-family HTH domain
MKNDAKEVNTENLETGDTTIILDSIGKGVDLVRNLVKARQKGGFTQENVAKMTGLKQSAIARLEAGVIIPRLDTLMKYATAIGCVIVCEDQETVAAVEHIYDQIDDIFVNVGGTSYHETDEYNVMMPSYKNLVLGGIA